MRRARRATALAAAVAGALALAACGTTTGEVDDLTQAIRRTRTQPRSFTFAQAADGRTVQIEGRIEDDFSHRASVRADGELLAEEIVVDDAIAFRAGTTASPGEPPADPSQGGPDPASRVPAGWIVDPDGAPATDGSAADAPADPVTSAIRMLDETLASMRQGLRVVEFNPESLDYRADEDTFPKPAEDSGVTRYDVVRPPLPTSATIAGNQPVPDPVHFRRMSVYVKDGLVTQVLEHIDVESRLEELARIYDVELPEDRPPAEVAEAYIAGVNALRVGQGSRPIEVRTMSLSIDDVGTQREIAIPDGAVAADVSSIRSAVLARVTGGGGQTTGLPDAAALAGGVDLPDPGAALGADADEDAEPALPVPQGAGAPVAALVVLPLVAAAAFGAWWLLTGRRSLPALR